MNLVRRRCKKVPKIKCWKCNRISTSNAKQTNCFIESHTFKHTKCKCCKPFCYCKVTKRICCNRIVETVEFIVIRLIFLDFTLHKFAYSYEKKKIQPIEGLGINDWSVGWMKIAIVEDAWPWNARGWVSSLFYAWSENETRWLQSQEDVAWRGVMWHRATENERQKREV